MAILIDFATRRPVTEPSEPRPQRSTMTSRPDRSGMFQRWGACSTALKIAMHEREALRHRRSVPPVGSLERKVLWIAYETAVQAHASAKEALMCTPAPHAEALAWKWRQKDCSPEAEAVMAEDEAFLAPRRRSSRQA